MEYRWRIWFDDRSSIAGCCEKNWNEAPRDGILIVREYGDHPLVHMGMDYYWFENGRVKSCNPKDLHGYLRRPEGLRNVKFGRWADDDIWKKARNEAMTDEL